MEKQEVIIGNPRRTILKMGISSMLLEDGIDRIEKQCLESLTEMMQCVIVEIGQSARNYCELSGRTQPVIGDVIIALINMGICVQGIESYAKRDNRHVIAPPQQIGTQKQLSLLQAGTKNAYPSYIPNYLPALPDPHAYIRTPTHKQPVTEHEAIREKAANQKRDIEKALTRFLAKTSDTHSLFDTEDNQMFPLIACKPSFPPYLAALNPTDQVFDFEELEYHYLVANRTEDVPSKEEEEEEQDDDMKNEMQKEQKTEIDEPATIDDTNHSSNQNNNPSIDNPYLRAAKVHRNKHDSLA